MIDSRVADEGQADMRLLHVDGLRHDELRVKPGRLATIDRGRVEQCPGSGVLITELLTLYPVGAVWRGCHAPQRIAFAIDGVVAIFLGLTIDAVNAVYQKIC